MRAWDEGKSDERMNKPPLPPALLARARELRENATDAEKLLWQLLRNRQLNGWKFRRQHPIGKYILDFYCHDAKLAIELDGSQHAETEQAEYDRQRTESLEAEGIRVLRFWNNEVLKETQAVVQEIWNALQDSLSPSPSPKGRGETPFSQREKGRG
jgi:very-short-patch-repair endonuclease